MYLTEFRMKTSKTPEELKGMLECLVVSISAALRLGIALKPFRMKGDVSSCCF